MKRYVVLQKNGGLWAACDSLQGARDAAKGCASSHGEAYVMEMMYSYKSGQIVETSERNLPKTCDDAPSQNKERWRLSGLSDMSKR